MRCNAVEPLLSEYIDNRLSARRTLGVDRHLADCHACTRTLNELRRTVGLVNSSPGLSVSAEFMASLQTRLDGLEPAPAQRAWISNVKSLFRPRILPAWGAVAGAAALTVLLFVPRGRPQNVDVQQQIPVETAAAKTASHQNVAISASDPFADIGSVNLAAHINEDSGGEDETAF